jgi:hypothetical protein
MMTTVCNSLSMGERPGMAAAFFLLPSGKGLYNVKKKNTGPAYLNSYSFFAYSGKNRADKIQNSCYNSY